MRLGVMLISLLLVGCDFFPSGPSSANTPEEMFAAVVESPVPQSVTNLEGVGDTWQGYALYLRFQAPDPVIHRIIAGSYQRVSWADIQLRFDLPKGYDRFSPSWSPSSIGTKACYEANVKNSWTHSGTHYLVIDRNKNLVYFAGFGS